MMRSMILLAFSGLIASVSTAIGTTADDEAAAYLDRVEKRIMAAWNLAPKSGGLKKVSLRIH